MTSYSALISDGLWNRNTAVVQLLGLCPLVAVSTTLVSAFSLGLATILVMAISSLVVSLLKNWIPETIRLPIFITIVATLTTIVELWITVLSYPLYLALGIYLPLIVTNCIVLARVETFASKNTPLSSLIDALAMGAGALIVLMILGAAREILGSGTLFAGIDKVLGARFSAIQVLPKSLGTFSIAILPFGGFFLLGLLMALKKAIDKS